MAQRRRRVFLVASARDGFDPGQVFFEFEGLRRDTAPSREAGARVANCITAGVGNADRDTQTGTLVGALDTECGYQSQAFQSVASGHVICTITSRMFNALGARDVKEGALQVCAPVNTQVITRGGKLGRGTGFGLGEDNDPAYTLQAAHSHGVFHGQRVRKLTPVECERLQGFTDNHTLLPHGPKQRLDAQMKAYYSAHLGRELTDEEQRALVGDGPRYKAIGNSKAVPVVRWVGVRLLDHFKQLGHTAAN